MLKARQAVIYYPVGPLPVPIQPTSAYHTLRLHTPIADRWILDGSADARFRKAIAHVSPEEQKALRARMHAHLLDILPLFSAQLLTVPPPPPRIRPPPTACKPRGKLWADLDSDDDSSSGSPGRSPYKSPSKSTQGQQSRRDTTDAHVTAGKPGSSTIGTQTCRMVSLESKSMCKSNIWDPSQEVDQLCNIGNKSDQESDEENCMGAYKSSIHCCNMQYQGFESHLDKEPSLCSSSPEGKTCAEHLAAVCSAGPSLNVSGLDLRGLGFVSDDSDTEDTFQSTASCSNSDYVQHIQHPTETLAHASFEGSQHLQASSIAPATLPVSQGRHGARVNFMRPASRASAGAGLSTSPHQFLPCDVPCWNVQSRLPGNSGTPSELPGIAMHDEVSGESTSTDSFHASPLCFALPRRIELSPTHQRCDEVKQDNNSSGFDILAAEESCSALSPTKAIPQPISFCQTYRHNPTDSLKLNRHQSMLPHSMSAMAANPRARRAGQSLTSGKPHAHGSEAFDTPDIMLPQKWNTALAESNPTGGMLAQLSGSGKTMCWTSVDEQKNACTMPPDPKSTDASLLTLPLTQHPPLQPLQCNQQTSTSVADSCPPRCTITSTPGAPIKCEEPTVTKNSRPKLREYYPETAKRSAQDSVSARSEQYAAVLGALRLFIEQGHSDGVYATSEKVCV
jgi:hypothetical protein